jgi:hypothetical protein
VQKLPQATCFIATSAAVIASFISGKAKRVKGCRLNAWHYLRARSFGFMHQALLD